jgi:enamine deaminase RidA (YjgF/YER057c/UK114 family)
MTLGKLTVLQPPDWPRPKGYANGIVGSGRVVFVAGQIGWDATGSFAEGLVPQIGQALRNVLAVLAQAGGGPEHIARLTWYITDIAAYRAAGKDLAKLWRDLMGRHFPVMAVVGVTALVEPAALVEIEATAVLPGLPTA